MQVRFDHTVLIVLIGMMVAALGVDHYRTARKIIVSFPVLFVLRKAAEYVFILFEWADGA